MVQKINEGSDGEGVGAEDGLMGGGGGGVGSAGGEVGL